MACPTCDHTMQSIAGLRFWCPRCGTLKNLDSFPSTEKPQLVDLVRKYAESKSHAQDGVFTELGSRGIIMSVHLPEDR